MATTTTTRKKTGKGRRPKPKRPARPTVQAGLAELLPEARADDESQVAVSIPIDLLDNQLTGVDDPDCRWRTQAEIDAAITTARKDGSLQNINVTPREGGRFWLEQGRHRTLAAKLAGRTTMAAFIHRNWSRKQATIAAVAENESRTADSPFHAGKQYQEALDAGNPLKEVIARTRWSEATVRLRLKIFRLGPVLGPLFAERLGHEDLPFVRPVAEDETLAADLAAYMRELEVIHGGRWLVTNWALNREHLCMPLGDSFVRSAANSNDYYVSGAIREDKEYEQAVRKLPCIEVGPKDHKILICLDPQGAVEAVQEAEARRVAAEKVKGKQRTKSGKDPEQVRKERIAKRCRSTGLGVLVKHLSSRPSFGPDMEKLVLKRLLDEVGQVAAAKVDQQALMDILGDHAPQDPKALEHGRSEFVDELYDEHRDVLMKYLLAIVYMRKRTGVGWNEFPHLVADKEVSVLLTGKTPAQLKAMAARAVDADLAKKEAKSNAKKAAQKGKRAQGSRPRATRAKTQEPSPTASPAADREQEPEAPPEEAPVPAGAGEDHTVEGNGPEPDLQQEQSPGESGETQDDADPAPAMEPGAAQAPAQPAADAVVRSSDDEAPTLEQARAGAAEDHPIQETGPEPDLQMQESSAPECGETEDDQGPRAPVTEAEEASAPVEVVAA